MKLAIIHYHLNRGGVTQVVLNHLRSLDEVTEQSLQVALLFGGRHTGWPEDVGRQLQRIQLGLHTVPELEYDEPGAAGPSPEHLASRLHAQLERLGFDPAETILHVHNHGLGKNASLPGALIRLTGRGYGLLLQIHDFAEDFRPENYRHALQLSAGGDPSRLSALWYPQTPRIHYAVLNGRDAGLLGAAGIRPQRLHALPNPVAEFGPLPDPRDARRKLSGYHPQLAEGRFVLYPVRGIRRKNIGELLLWAACAGGSEHFGLTLAPLNPVEQTGYQRWRALAAELELPCLFEVGGLAGVSFLDNLAAADQVITTSVAEGFGMVFLEAWLAGRRLVGRDLPEITADFKAQGVDLNALYARLAVPVDWIGRDVLRRHLVQLDRTVRGEFGLASSPGERFDREFHAIVASDRVDFAVLPGALQAGVIRAVRDDTARRAVLVAENPALHVRADEPPAGAADLVAENAAIVRREFSLSASGRRLLQIYRAVLEQSAEDGFEQPARGETILERLLQLSRLQPIRIEP